MEKKNIETFIPIEEEAAALRGIRLFATKVDLVPGWFTEGLSVNPYFGATEY